MRIGIGTGIVVATRNLAETGGMVGNQTVVEKPREKGRIGENAVDRGGARIVADPGTGGIGRRRLPGDRGHRLASAARMLAWKAYTDGILAHSITLAFVPLLVSRHAAVSSVEMSGILHGIAGACVFKIPLSRLLCVEPTCMPSAT